jgi:hypothetical protein
LVENEIPPCFEEVLRSVFEDMSNDNEESIGGENVSKGGGVGEGVEEVLLYPNIDAIIF